MIKELTFGGRVVKVTEACDVHRDSGNVSSHSSEMRIALRGYSVEDTDHGMMGGSGHDGELEIVLATSGVMRFPAGTQVSITITDLGVLPRAKSLLTGALVENKEVDNG